ncbi:hypothetical protein OIU84_027776 [Salix udensis]|uniref:Uncharacterized protein n=1 Tax=Salix udensis TaxID=889485 RepID=A0AAD6KHM4_9ROSI|nr:hypothetical protein OIU84_027776 [Salix udensis]
MGLSHLIQRSITKKLLPSKPSNIISSSWFLADTTAKSFDLSGGSNGAKINSFDDNDSLKISKSSYHVSSGGFMRGVVFWEPNKPVTIEEFQMPRPKAGEVLIKTKACGKLWNTGSCQIEKLLKDFQLALVLLELLSCLVVTVSTVLRAMMIYVRIFLLIIDQKELFMMVKPDYSSVIVESRFPCTAWEALLNTVLFQHMD